VRSVAGLASRDDLLLFLERGPERATLHIALGGPRARITTTTQRFPREAFTPGPFSDRLTGTLAGAALRQLAQPEGERRCSLAFLHPDRGRLSLELELFGTRGLWALLDGGGKVLEISRDVDEKERRLRRGEGYAPPRAKGGAPEQPARFAEPVLAAIDEHFTRHDLAEDAEAARREVAQALAAQKKRVAAKVAGLQAQRVSIEQAPQLRQTADLLLAYSSQIRRGQQEAVLPDPERDGEVVRIALDPSKPVRAQIEAIYERARRLEDSAEVSARRQRESEAELADLEALERRLAAATDGVEPLRAELVARGLLKARSAPTKPPAQKKLEKVTHGENFRRFVSAEGFPILCGKSNEQNDKLSLRVAAGNDLWFHVGQGYAGSHVVMRLPKGKTASLESLLDAGTVAIHFSKARGATTCDVDYTFAKHVRKPKGFPPGKVTITQNKTVRVRLEKDRLARLLATSGGDQE
jgi:predicted ribosome quality control (RQC) complex YloA/Tae2 family protein